jgi:hypothetical protein
MNAIKFEVGLINIYARSASFVLIVHRGLCMLAHLYLQRSWTEMRQIH